MFCISTTFDSRRVEADVTIPSSPVSDHVSCLSQYRFALTELPQSILSVILQQEATLRRMLLKPTVQASRMNNSNAGVQAEDRREPRRV